MVSLSKQKELTEQEKAKLLLDNGLAEVCERWKSTFEPEQVKGMLEKLTTNPDTPQEKSYSELIKNYGGIESIEGVNSAITFLDDLLWGQATNRLPEFVFIVDYIAGIGTEYENEFTTNPDTKKKTRHDTKPHRVFRFAGRIKDGENEFLYKASAKDDNIVRINTEQVPLKVGMVLKGTFNVWRKTPVFLGLNVAPTSTYEVVTDVQFSNFGDWLKANIGKDKPFPAITKIAEMNDATDDNKKNISDYGKKGDDATGLDFKVVKGTVLKSVAYSVKANEEKGKKEKRVGNLTLRDNSLTPDMLKDENAKILFSCDVLPEEAEQHGMGCPVWYIGSVKFKEKKYGPSGARVLFFVEDEKKRIKNTGINKVAVNTLPEGAEVKDTKQYMQTLVTTGETSKCDGFGYDNDPESNACNNCPDVDECVTKTQLLQNTINKYYNEETNNIDEAVGSAVKELGIENLKEAILKSLKR